MPREAWNLLSLEADRPVRIDLSHTPLANIARDSVVLGAIAYKVDDAIARVAIFRNDPKDEKPVNQYQYDVCVNLSAHPLILDNVAVAFLSVVRKHRAGRHAARHQVARTHH